MTLSGGLRGDTFCWQGLQTDLFVFLQRQIGKSQGSNRIVISVYFHFFRRSVSQCILMQYSQLQFRSWFHCHLSSPDIPSSKLDHLKSSYVCGMDGNMTYGWSAEKMSSEMEKIKNKQQKHSGHSCQIFRKALSVSLPVTSSFIVLLLLHFLHSHWHSPHDWWISDHVLQETYFIIMLPQHSSTESSAF